MNDSLAGNADLSSRTGSRASSLESATQLKKSIRVSARQRNENNSDAFGLVRAYLP
jgi:hypothetical protein